MTSMKYITLILFIISFGSILTGFFTQSEKIHAMVSDHVFALTIDS